jgi:asparagine synthase (glutamine-hydrolysing)
MKHWTLHLQHGSWNKIRTSNGEQTNLKGQCYRANRLLNPIEFTKHISDALDISALGTALSALNGFYAWVAVSERRLCAGVDHIRSRPIFFGESDNHLFVSDDADWVRLKVGDKTMDPMAREEFLFAGYVTGPDTLYPKVKQLQAGECLLATFHESRLRIETNRFYRFLHVEPKTYTAKKLGAELDSVAIDSIQRLITYAGGRQIVLPLSGGYDSRLIATLLRRSGYDNVLAFSYGVPGNVEAAISKRVADALGFRWTFIEYSNAIWSSAWSTPEAKSQFGRQSYKPAEYSRLARCKGASFDK